MMRSILFVVLFTLTACGSDKKGTENNLDPDVGNSADSAPDQDVTVSTDTSEIDVGSDLAVVLPSCNGAVALDQTIDINPAGQPGQLYARASWDGTGAWVVYAGPAVASGPEAVFLTRVDCKGAIEIGPLQLSPENVADRHLTPVIVSRNETTFVAWYSQAATGETTIWTRIFDRAGTEITAGPVDVTPQENGAPVSDRIWDVDIAALSESVAAIAVSIGTVDGFDVGVQLIDGAGNRGAFFIPVPDDADQTKPSIGYDDAGNLSLSWIRKSNGEDDQAMLTQIPTGAMMGNPASGVPARPLATPNPLARMAKHPSGVGAMFHVFQITNAQQSDIVVRSASDLGSTASATFGTLQQNNFRPSIATGDS